MRSPQPVAPHLVHEGRALLEVQSRCPVDPEQSISEPCTVPVADETEERILWRKGLDGRGGAGGEYVDPAQRKRPLRKPSRDPVGPFLKEGVNPGQRFRGPSQ